MKRKNRFQRNFRNERSEHKHKWRKNYPFGVKSTCVMRCKICNEVRRVNKKGKVKITVTQKPILTKVLISFFLLMFLAVNVITADKMICNNSEGNTYAIEMFNKSIEKEMGLNVSNMNNFLNESCVIIPDNLNNLPIDCAFVIQKLNDKIVETQALAYEQSLEMKELKKQNNRNIIVCVVVIALLFLITIWREREWRKTN